MLALFIPSISVTDPVARPLPDTTSNDGDYVLIEQITYLDDIKGKLDEQIGNEKDLAKKIGDALKTIDEKLRTNAKTIEDQKKKIEEQDKTFKKLDKSTKQEIQLLKNQLTAEKDRYSNVGKELKERNKEVKRLETRCNAVTLVILKSFLNSKFLVLNAMTSQKRQRPLRRKPPPFRGSTPTRSTSFVVKWPA